MFRYRLHSPDGDDLGEATYAIMIKPGEEIHSNGGERLRVLDVVPFDEEDDSPFVRLLQVEAFSDSAAPTGEGQRRGHWQRFGNNLRRTVTGARVSR